MPKVKAKKKTKGTRTAINKKLAAGADKIKKAQADAKAKVAPLEIKETTRAIEEILKERVEILPHSVGLKIDKETPIEENLKILDWASAMNDHVGFFIGDVLNHGQHAYGEKYQRALNQTGRAYSTLAQYAEVARKIAPSARIAALSYTHHREVLRIGDSNKIATMLEALEEELDAGKTVTTRELHERVVKVKPAKKRAAAKPSKNGEKKTAAYEPSDDEKNTLASVERTLRSIKASDVKFVAKMNKATREQWARLLTPWANLCDDLLR
jgi:hypothetical protein